MAYRLPISTFAYLRRTALPGTTTLAAPDLASPPPTPTPPIMLSGRRRVRRLNDATPALATRHEVVCIICGNPASEPSGEEKPVHLHTLPCRHVHCNHCLTSNFMVSIEGAFRPVKCCSRNPSIDPDILRAAVDPKEVAKHMPTYLAKLEERNCADKLYCHKKTCSAFIPENQRTQRVGTCPKCGLKTCKRCKAKSHFGVCSAEKLKELKGDEQLLALAEDKQWKQCPRCSTMVERLLGCAHMTCVCGCDFCYICGQMASDTHVCKLMVQEGFIVDDDDEDDDDR